MSGNDLEKLQFAHTQNLHISNLIRLERIHANISPAQQQIVVKGMFTKQKKFIWSNPPETIEESSRPATCRKCDDSASFARGQSVKIWGEVANKVRFERMKSQEEAN